MHILPSSKLFDELMLYAFDLPVMVISAIIVVVSLISLVLWVIGSEYYQVPM
jgi:hypothetical protein